MVNGKHSITAKPAARLFTHLQPSPSSSAIRQEVALISKRVSDLEGSLAFAQEQIQERDERLFECQQNIAEDIAKGISDGLDRQRIAGEAHYVCRLRSKDEEIQHLRSRIARFESDVQEKGSLVQNTLELRPQALVLEVAKEKIEQAALPPADITRAGANSFLILL